MSTKNYGQEINKLAGDVAAQREILKEFVREVLEEGVDYGLIQGIPTPTLFKPGAEKILALFDCGRETRIVNSHVDWDREYQYFTTDYRTKELIPGKLVKGLISYEIECKVFRKSDGQVIGSGVGAANSFEKKFGSQGDGVATQNTIIKMAEKRSMVDAALTLSMVSGMFTQDVEDMDLGKEDHSPAPQKSYRKPSAPAAGTVDENEDDWIVDFGSASFIGKPLSELPPASISWYAKAIQKNISDPTKKAYIEKNTRILNKIKKVAASKGVPV